MSDAFTSHGYCPTIYGPVESRRHGLSLGINLGLVDQKVCTWGCLYCQCGMGQRREFESSESRPTANEVLKLLELKLQTLSKLDSITFAGNTEPTTHPEFGTIVEGALNLRERYHPKCIVNILSNGSELESEGVVAACNKLDESWIKLDCALDGLFLKLNRPLEKVGSTAKHVERVQQLNKIYIQTILWQCDDKPELANASPENLKALLEAYKKIRPIKIHVTTIARKPAVEKLGPVTEALLASFVSTLRDHGFTTEYFI